jgi:hypothetical protein
MQLGIEFPLTLTLSPEERKSLSGVWGLFALKQRRPYQHGTVKVGSLSMMIGSVSLTA